HGKLTRRPNAVFAWIKTQHHFAETHHVPPAASFFAHRERHRFLTVLAIRRLRQAHARERNRWQKNSRKLQFQRYYPVRPSSCSARHGWRMSAGSSFGLSR